MAASPSPGSDDQFAIGTTLDNRYRIEAVLGTGGMGRVYRAEHTGNGESVAIKVLHADLTRNREALQRFKREVLASRRLAHPNIVGFSEGGVLDDGSCYLVMEMLEGESLGDRLGREHQIPWDQAIDILRGVLHGLRHAHECNVVHRDIKPDNVYLAHKDGELVIKILDFGIAKFVAGDPDDPALTRAGLTVGTPAYLSPEQAVGGAITPASDLYSASVVMYEMLAGRAPFEDKDPLAMLGAHVSRPPPKLAEVAPGVEVPAALEDIVQRGLRKVPADRIGTASLYLELLDQHWPLRTRSMWTAASDADAAHEAVAAGAPTRPAAAAPDAAASPPSSNARPAPVAPSGPAMTAATARSAGDAGRRISVEMAQLPRAARAMSLGDVSEPIPLTWILRSGILIGVLIIAAIALAIGAHCRGSEPSEKPALSAPGSGSDAKRESTGKPPRPETTAKPPTSAAPETPAPEVSAPPRPAPPPRAPGRQKPPPQSGKPPHRP